MKIPARTIAYVTLLVYWGPSNALYYLWGFILFFFIALAKPEWLRFKGVFSRSIVNLTLIFWFLFFISALINYPLLGSSLNNLFWSILTFGSSFTILLALLAVPFKKEDLPKIFRFSLYLTLFQVILGYFQMLKAQGFSNINPFAGGIDAGDFFVGTTFDPGTGNMAAIKISLMAMLFVPLWVSKRDFKSALILGFLFLGWVLASAIYTLILGLLVIIFFLVVVRIWRAAFTFQLNKSIFYITILGIGGIIMFIYTQKDNVIYMVESIKEIYATVIDEGARESSRKVVFYKETLVKLPIRYPSTPFIGVGPGNYSSRSAWLVSGEYLQNQPSYIPITPSIVAEEYTLSLWSVDMIAQGFKGAGSITNQPFSTWLSVFAELGIIALIIFALIFYSLYRGFVVISNLNHNRFTNDLVLGLRMSLVYIVLLFFVDNLFEWPLVMGQFFVFSSLIIRLLENQTNVGTNSRGAPY